MFLIGIRGATTVTINSRKEILEKARELILQISQENNLIKENIASVFFTMTDDINAEFPAVAARELGWTDVPLLCTGEIKVAKALEKCIRILIHYNCEVKTKAKHVYLHEAKKLRPDLVGVGRT